jgi:hypothetical protein
MSPSSGKVIWCQLFKNLRRFRDTLRLHPQGKSSGANHLKTSDVSETHSAFILRESDLVSIVQKPPTFQRHTVSTSSGKVKVIWSLSLRMKKECVSEKSEVFKQLTRLSAREEFIQLKIYFGYIEAKQLPFSKAFLYKINNDSRLTSICSV